MLLESRRSSHSEASSSAGPLGGPRDSSQLGLEATLEAAVGAGIQAGMDMINAGVGAGESAFQTLLSTNPDPDHVTHVSTNTAAEEARQDGDAFSPASSHSPSEDSNKENNVELVNMAHANTPGKQDSEVQLKTFGSSGDRFGSEEVRLSLTEEEEEQQDSEAQGLLSRQQQKSDEPDPVRSKVSLRILVNLLACSCARVMYVQLPGCTPWPSLTEGLLLAYSNDCHFLLQCLLSNVIFLTNQ